jgi:hypothetical protein
MALSPNYGWAEPDNSSLVKNGAQDIRALGDAIDTSVWNVGYGQAGKNKIINGDFGINQRNFTTATSDGTYTFDRWVASNTGISCTYTPQTFTAGAAPVAGYEATNFVRILTTGQTATSERTILVQRIENVRSFAGQTATVSFWAKAATGTPKMAVELSQNFGSGGSASVNNYGGQVTLSTAWARYSVTIAVPSISGKTIGTSNFLALNLWVSAGSDFNSRTGSLGIQSNTFDIWGVQLEYGSKATPFQTATGTIQGELQACRRYLPAYVTSSLIGYAYATNGAIYTFSFDTPARTTPTGILVSGTFNAYGLNTSYSVTPIFNEATVNQGSLNVTSGLTIVAGQGSRIAGGGLVLFTGCEL